MSTKPVVDPWDEAMNPPELPNTQHGKLTVQLLRVMFVEDPMAGKKVKVPYDPKCLNPDGSEPTPVSAIKLTLVPVNEKLQFNTERELLITNNDWSKITLPSIKDLGIMKLPELDGKYVEAEMVPTRTYTDKNGQQKQATTFKFLRLFPDETACCAAAWLDGNAPQAPVATAPGTNGNSERATAEKFLKVYVTNAARKGSHDLTKTRQELAVMLAQQPLLSKYFTVDSPEVTELIMAEMDQVPAQF